MQNQHFGYKVKGFYKIAYFALQEANLDPIANKRYQAISFYKKHGLFATLDAFNIKRRTLFNWQKTLKDNGYNIAYLAPKSTAPKRCRSNSWQPSIVEHIKMLRERYPNICKNKLFALLIPHCQTNNLKILSVSTIGKSAIFDVERFAGKPQYIDKDSNSFTYAIYISSSYATDKFQLDYRFTKAGVLEKICKTSLCKNEPAQ